MEHDDLTPRQAPAEPVAPAPAPEEKQPDPNPKASTESALSGLYDRLPNIPLKALDVFIGVCVAAFIAVVIVGFVQGHR